MSIYVCVFVRLRVRLRVVVYVVICMVVLEGRGGWVIWGWIREEEEEVIVKVGLVRLLGFKWDKLF